MSVNHEMPDLPSERLRELMRADERTATKLAKKVEMQPSLWSYYRSGGAVPSLDQAGRILTALGKTFRDLEPKEGE